MIFVRCLLLLLLTGFGSADETKTLYVYNWSEYTPEDILKQFTEETGIEVRLSTYDSNEVLYTKLKILNAGGYDLVFPSTYYVQKMIHENMLHELDKEKLPNLKHLNPKLMGKEYDSKNRYSLPYLWGNTAISYREQSGLKAPTSLKDLWKPEYKGQVLLLDDMREVFAVSLRSLGYSANTTDKVKIREAYEHLKELMPNVRIFNSESPRQAFLTGEVGVGMNYNGDAFRAEETDRGMKYIYPSEGATLWVDSMVIPKNARSVAEAHLLMNFLMRPEIAQQISVRVGYSSPNRTAVEGLSDTIRMNPIVYPPDDVVEKMEILNEVGRSVFEYEYWWERLKVF